MKKTALFLFVVALLFTSCQGDDCKVDGSLAGYVLRGQWDNLMSSVSKNGEQAAEPSSGNILLRKLSKNKVRFNYSEYQGPVSFQVKSLALTRSVSGVVEFEYTGDIEIQLHGIEHTVPAVFKGRMSEKNLTRCDPHFPSFNCEFKLTFELDGDSYVLDITRSREYGW